VRTTKPTGSAECPPEIERAHAIEHLMVNQVASGVVCDNDLDDEIIEISLDDIGPKEEVKTPIIPKEESKTYVAHRIKQESELGSQGRASAPQLRGTLQTVVRALDPATHTAREDTRHTHRLDVLHTQGLTTQLHDAQVELWGMRKEVHDLQRELDRESRHADNAERDL
jgi:hypothetical protein